MLTAMSGRPIAGSRLRGALALAGTLALTLGTASAASAAETVIGFDHFPGGAPVPAGTIVTNEWEVEGLKLGKAEAFGQPSVAGNCGSPKVEKETVVPAASPPNFAVLPTCFGAANTQGTFGALLGPPRGSLSVEVRNLTSTPNVEVHVIGYSSTGTKVAEGHGQATNGSWQPIAVTLNGAGKISYFAISTGIVTSQEIAIDNLSFEKVEEEGKKEKEAPKEEPNKGGSGTPPTPPPTAVGTVVTPNPHGGSPVTLSGAGSSSGSGHIISYEWDFNSDGKIDTSTGTNPIAHVIMPTGLHTIGLTVTNSNGEKSSSKFGVLLQGVSIPPPDSGEGPCLTSLEVANAELLAECIQTKGSGEWVIESKELELNGMVLIPKGGGYGIYHVTSHRQFGIGTEYKLSGTPVNIELLNTPVGDMTLGGYDLETEPVTLGTAFEKRQVLKITAPLRAHAADEERVKNLKGNPLMSFGVGKPCTGGEKGRLAVRRTGPTKPAPRCRATSRSPAPWSCT